MDNVIDTISLTQLPNGAHFNYMQTTLERIEADEIVKGKVGKELTILKAAFATEDASLKASQKSALSDEITEADKHPGGGESTPLLPS